MGDLSATVYSKLLNKPSGRALLGRVVIPQNSSRRFYQLGELYVDQNLQLLRCDWLQSQHKQITIPAQTQLEMVQSAPVWKDDHLEAPQFLFAQSAWERGSITMLAPKHLKMAAKPQTSKPKKSKADVNRPSTTAVVDEVHKTKKQKTNQPIQSQADSKPPGPKVVEKAPQTNKPVPADIPSVAEKASSKRLEPFDITKKYPCLWKPGCKLPARFCGEGSRFPKHCSDHRQPSANLDFYLLKGRGGFPFGSDASDAVESSSEESDSSNSSSDSDETDSS
jgi:hypothetical protein